METIEYSEKSFVVFGSDEITKRYKEELKKLGGRFNSKLGVEEKSLKVAMVGCLDLIIVSPWRTFLMI